MSLDLLVLYEDSTWRRLWPLTAVRPVWSMRVGASSLWEKPVLAFRPRRWAVDLGTVKSDAETRSPVIEAFASGAGVPSAPQDVAAQSTVLWWNGAAIPGRAPLPPLPAKARGVRYLGGERRVAGLHHRAHDTNAEDLRDLLFAEAQLPAEWEETELAVDWVSELWDLVRLLPGQLARDLDQRLSQAGPARAGGAHVLGQRVLVASDARVDAGAVLDSRQGPVLIDEGAVVEPLTLVVGPAYVGPRTQLLGGKIAIASLGPDCRVGGEVEHSVFQGYANKRHQGFLGHSVVGEWVNLGAMTTNSDLKNNYGTVRVWVNGRDEESGETKIGCFLGDHVKTGIGTLIATGAVVGPGSNLFAGGRYTPRYLPGWSWWDGDSVAPHRWDRFLATTRVIMGRRERALTPAYELALLAGWKKGPKAL